MKMREKIVLAPVTLLAAAMVLIAILDSILGRLWGARKETSRSSHDAKAGSYNRERYGRSVHIVDGWYGPEIDESGQTFFWSRKRLHLYVSSGSELRLLISGGGRTVAQEMQIAFQVKTQHNCERHSVGGEPAWFAIALPKTPCHVLVITNGTWSPGGHDRRKLGLLILRIETEEAGRTH